MNSTQFNELVRDAARNQPLRGVKRNAGGPSSHHWKTRVARVSGDPRQWRCYVGPGVINDRVAAITYLRTGDPRGWEMPPDYPGIAAMQRIYGSGFTVVDRVLTEKQDRPHLLLTAPSEDGSDTGDFERVPDEYREPFFMTEPMWKLDLWQAVVFATAAPRRYSRVENSLGFPAPTSTARFRVATRSRMPDLSPGIIAAGGQIELARLFLTRDPARPDRDAIHVQQRVFWSLATRNVEPLLDIPALGEIGNIVLGGLSDLLGSGASVQFWSV